MGVVWLQAGFRTWVCSLQLPTITDTRKTPQEAGHNHLTLGIYSLLSEQGHRLKRDYPSIPTLLGDQTHDLLVVS